MNKISINGTGENLYTFQHSSGLKVYIWQNLKSHNIHAAMNVLYGATSYQYIINNKIIKDKTGIAHFLEHVMFNINSKRNAMDLFNQLGSFTNAYTDTLNTCYYIFIKDEIKKNLDVLLEMMFTPYFTQKLVAKERGIITEEKRKASNDPYRQAYEHFICNIFHYDNIRETTLGTFSDIKDINSEDLQLVYDSFYHPCNMQLVMCGNCNPYEVEKIVNEFLADYEFKPYVKAVPYSKKEPATIVRKSEIIEGNVEIPKIRMAIKIKRSKFKNYNKKELLIMLNMLLRCNFGSTSTFREYLVENNLVTSINATRAVMKDFVIIYVSAESNFPEQVIPLIKEKMNNLELTKKDLTRKINSSIATYITNFEENEIVSDTIIANIIEYGDISLNYIDEVKKVKYEKVNNLINLIDTTEMSEMILMPKKSS